MRESFDLFLVLFAYVRAHADVCRESLPWLQADAGMQRLSFRPCLVGSNREVQHMYSKRFLTVVFYLYL
jgi:hypothetical protein